eukprot:TRINITY_DN3844_c0_g1_i6.p3 TRINITY_DN3844_c0_g1~~TRINITY_DN3844_c0_g1_i6.p3  ORF type:complete len:112 (-),score=31.27 TRINITY_DN3844_c0_g1_i6:42-377(-)
MGLDGLDIATWLITPADLQEAVCGTSSILDTPLRKLFRVVSDDELLGCQPLQDALWKVLDRMESTKKAQLLMFVTGTERPPLPGTEVLRIEMPFFAPVSYTHLTLPTKRIV